MKHIVNLSGGKDSTALLLGMLERGMTVDYIVFADTGKDFPQMLTHLEKLENQIICDYNAPSITRLKADKSFDYYMFDHERTTGKHKGECGYGWATMWARWCTTLLKTQLIDRFIKSLNDEFTQYIGIAADEPKRLKIVPNRKYPLAEWGMSEKQALAFCYERGYDWGGLYNHFDRVSCWCCPLKNLRELKTLFLFYPDLWAQLKDMDYRAYNQFRADYSVLELEQKFIAEIEAERARSEYNLFNYLKAD